MDPPDHALEEAQHMTATTATAAATAMEQTAEATQSTGAVPAARRVAEASLRPGVLQLAVPRAVRLERIVAFVRAVVEQRAVLMPGAEQLHAEDSATEGRSATVAPTPGRAEATAETTRSCCAPLRLYRRSHRQHHRQGQQPRPEHPSHGKNPFRGEGGTAAGVGQRLR